MQTVFKMLFFFTLLYAITTQKVMYTIIYQENYWSNDGYVDIVVIQDKLAVEKMSNFSMMLQDNEPVPNYYRAKCTVLPQYEGDEIIPNKETGENLIAKNAFCYFDQPKFDTFLGYYPNSLEVPEDAKFEVEIVENFLIEYHYEAKPGGDGKKSDQPGGDDKKSDQPGGDDKKSDQPGGDDTKSDQPGGDGKKSDHDKKSDQPGGDDKKSDQPGGDDKKTDEKGGDDKKSDQPGGDTKKSDQPGGDG